MKSSTDKDHISIFGSADAAKPLPNHRFPANAMHAEESFQLIRDELMLDGNARQNLATFCQTWDDPQVHRLMDLCISKNMIDKDEYPQCAEIEQRCVRMIADLWNAPEPANVIGCSTIGSSEACMLGGMAALHRWRARRKKAGKPTDKPNLVCGPVQICWHKFCRYWDVEIREVPMAHGRYCMNAAEMLKLVDENTICVVPTFGVTYTGQYEFPEELCRALDELAAKGGPDVDVHVDGASGGFLAPFLAPDIKFDFRLPRVKSISSSGHKYGLAPVGCGWVLWRTQEDMPQELCFAVNYLGGSIPTIALNFSRPAGQVIAQYYTFVHLGKEGYKRIHQAAYDVAAYLHKKIAKLGKFEFIATGNPQTDIPAVCFYMKKGYDPGFNLYELSDRLRTRGWQVPAFSLPAKVEDIVVMRVMVRRGVTMDMADLLLHDMERGMAFLSQHSQSVHTQEHEAGMFKHT
ncbi:MAG: glutamate decarboxylase [Akkermansiaceae bacterium]|nr:glutamate decarboxylase [Akkermansiaceae bacterium]